MIKKQNDIFVNLIRGVTPIKKNNKLERNIPEISENAPFQKSIKKKLSLSEKKELSTDINISNFEIERNKNDWFASCTKAIGRFSQPCES